MRTLMQLREDLADQSGIPTIEAHDAPMRYTLNSQLKRAQEFLYQQYKWEDMYRFWQILTTAQVSFYPIVAAPTRAWAPTTNFVIKDVIFDGANYQMAQQTGLSGLVVPIWATQINVSTQDSGTAWICLGSTPPPSPGIREISGVWLIYNNAWLPVDEGIDPRAYTLVANMYPHRYARRQSNLIELWPVPDNVYDIQVGGYQMLAQFKNDADVTTLDDEVVLLYAIAKTKAALSKPDAGVAMQEALTYLRALRAKNHGNQRFIPGRRQPPVRPMPIITNPM